MRGSRSSRSAGLPHSDIPGSRPVCGSPGLIAAYHVLRRLLVPRHPPCAFSRLISNPRVVASAGFLTHHVTRLRLSNSGPPPANGPGTGRSERKSEKCETGVGDKEAFRPPDRAVYSALQKGGDPAAGSPTATLLRLRPSHRIDLRRLPPCGWPTGFGSLRLPWRDGRCVQGPGTYSPRRG